MAPTQQVENVVNLTTVARMLHASTPVARAKLDKHGLVPVSEITMPGSGRTYTLYKADEALDLVKKLEEEKRPAVKMNAPKPAPEAVKASQDVTQDIIEIKSMINLLAQAVQNAQKDIEASKGHKSTRRGHQSA